MNQSDTKALLRVARRMNENAESFDQFKRSGGLSTLDGSHVLVLVNATDPVGRHFVENVLGLPAPPRLKVPKHLKAAVVAGPTWGLFVVPKDAFTGMGALRASLDEAAPFGTFTVVIIESSGLALTAWSPKPTTAAQA
jgi:hypothetical protein